MARTARLTALPQRRRPALLLILVAVLAAHVLVLYWLAHARAPASLLRPLATPMFTRLLQPTAPPVVEAAAPAPAAAARRRPVARQVTPSTPPSATPTMATAEQETPPPPETVAAAAAPTPMPTPTLEPEPEREPAAAAVEAGQPAGKAAEADTSAEEALARPDGPASTAESSPSQGAADAAATSAESATAAIAPPEETGAGADADSALSAAAALAPAPSQDSWPGDTRLSYELSGRFRSGDLYGNARVQWQREGTRYQTRVEVELPPWLNQILTSQGEVGPNSLRPEVYEETRHGKSRSVRLGEDTITLANGERIARPDGVQDTASQFVELSHRFATGRDRLEVGGSVSLWLVRPGGMDLWTYDIVQRETLRTPQLGEIEAFHLKPRPLARPRGNISAEMWFAPSLQFLPVRIRVKMGEEAEVDLLVSTIEQR